VPAAHDSQACVEEEEYLPALQGVHNVAPVEASEFVTLPAAHVSQEEDDVLPINELYLPAAHNVHACVEEEEYLPAPQGVHDEAPAEASEFVTLPAAHVWQDSVEEAEYVLGLQGVHDDAPVKMSEFVMLPAAHAMQEDWPEEGL